MSFNFRSVVKFGRRAKIFKFRAVLQNKIHLAKKDRSLKLIVSGSKSNMDSSSLVPCSVGLTQVSLPAKLLIWLLSVVGNLNNYIENCCNGSKRVFMALVSDFFQMSVAKQSIQVISKG